MRISASFHSFILIRDFDQFILLRKPIFVDQIVTISFLQFSTGEPHPLAPKHKLEVSVSRLAALNLSHITVIGDYILYCAGASLDNAHGLLCGIYLVAWREGWISRVRLPTYFDDNLK